MLHGPKRGRRKKRERGSTRERCKLVFVWASAVPETRTTTTAATRAFTLASFTTLLSIARQRAGKKALCQTCCSCCYCALFLSRMHCVKLAPLIVVAAAVHFNALFRTPFLSLPLHPLSAFAVAI